MQRDLLLYQRALYLRKKKGYSYREIMAEIPVAKSTLSGWLSRIELSAEQNKSIRQRSLAKVQEFNKFHLGEWNRKRRQLQVQHIRVNAKKHLGNLNTREILITGTMLYWAEGSKGGTEVRITNSDPAFIKFMMYWFRNCLNIGEDRFRVGLHYHQGQSEQDIKQFWSNLTGIPLNQFIKSFCKPPGTGHRKHYLQHGTIQIRLTKSADLFHQIAGWKDGLIQNVISGKNLT